MEALKFLTFTDIHSYSHVLGEYTEILLWKLEKPPQRSLLKNLEVT